MFSLVSDMCDDCFEKVNHYTPDFEYTKEYIKREFWLPDGEYSFIDLLMFYSDCERKVHNEIGDMCAKRKKHFVTIFDEFDNKETMKELIQTRHAELEYSFFFGDTTLDTLACFEDRNKRRSVLFR
ncbi:MAG: hypothetical protein Q8942_14145 [Bacillota bacterium]|nr:hypothetical protein [Bacillota bacterium]